MLTPHAWAANSSSAQYFIAKNVWIAPTGQTQLNKTQKCSGEQCYITSTESRFVYLPQSAGVTLPLGSIVALQSGSVTTYATVVQITNLKDGAMGISQKLAHTLNVAGAPTKSVGGVNIKVIALPNTQTRGDLPSDDAIDKVGANEFQKFATADALKRDPVLSDGKKFAEIPADNVPADTTAGSQSPTPSDKGADGEASGTQATTGANEKDFAEYRPLIGGTLLPGVSQDLGVHRVLTAKDNENAAYDWLRIDVLKKFANLLIGWTAAIAVVAIIFGAYQYLTAVGDAEQIKSAHKTITFSLIGVAIALLAFAVVQVIVNIDLTGETASTAATDTVLQSETPTDFCPTSPPTVLPAEFEAKKQAVCSLLTKKADVPNCSGALVKKILQDTAVPHTERQVSYYSVALELLQSDGRKYDATAAVDGYDAPTSVAYGLFRAAQCDGRLATWNAKKNNFLGDLLTTAGLVALSELLGKKPTDLKYTQNPNSWTSQTFPAACGNYFLEKGEQCDAGPKGSAYCGAPNTANACKRIIGCGNSVIDPGEQCDAGPNGNTVCGAPNTANACKAITACGNYRVEIGEQCDNGPNGSNICGAPGTAGACQKILGCGNGVIEAGEQCDAGPLGNTYCGAPSSANACQRITATTTIVDRGTGTHYPRPEPSGPYATPTKPVRTTPSNNFVSVTKPGDTSTGTPGQPGKINNGKKQIIKKDPDTGKDNQPTKNNDTKNDADNGVNQTDTNDDADTIIPSVSADTTNDDTGLLNPFGLLAANVLWDVTAPSSGTRNNLDTTGISLFDQPLLLLAALPGQVIPDSNPRDKIIPCSGGSGCSLEVGALPQSNFRDEFLPVIARLLIYAMTSVAFVIFFVAGAMMVLSYGDAEMNKKAKNMLIWGIVGLSFAAAAYALVTGVLDIKFGTFTGSSSGAEEQSTSDGAATTDEAKDNSANE